jgi:hypothetical protein
MAAITFKDGEMDEFDVALVSWTYGEPVILGEISDAFDGTERDCSRGIKKTGTFVTGFVETSVWAAIDAALTPGTEWDFSGDVLGGSTWTASGRVVSVQVVPGLDPAAWTVTFTHTQTTAS